MVKKVVAQNLPLWKVGDLQLSNCWRYVIVIISILGSISQKRIRIRKKAFIKKCMETHQSIVHFLVFANTSTQFRRSGQVWLDRVLMIKYQDKS